MGILDDAIREHLDLKRQHGADESEVEGLEAEAFGPADRPEATDAPPADPASSGDAEALTQVISPGSSLTAPAGEGDQLDKVFESSRGEDQSPDQEQSEEPSFEEHELPPGGDSTTGSQQSEPSQAEEQDPTASEAQAEVDPAVDVAGDAADTSESETDDGGGDAGDALELERQHLAGQPTEHYDVDAAIAEEDEIDLLSESSLSDELDRALDGPGEPEREAQPAEPEPEIEPEQPETEPAAGPEVALDEGAADKEATGEDTAGEEATDQQADPEDADFFDQEDPLEGTPDFLEETPEHDRLWFEQKEPKDFDFGD